MTLNTGTAAVSVPDTPQLNVLGCTASVFKLTVISELRRVFEEETLSVHSWNVFVFNLVAGFNSD